MNEVAQTGAQIVQITQIYKELAMALAIGLGAF
jgi:hypothetical protein